MILTIKIKVKSEVELHKDIVIERPSYMSKEELKAHLKDAEDSLLKEGKYTFDSFVRKLEDMGFYTLETLTDVVEYEKSIITDVQIAGDV